MKDNTFYSVYKVPANTYKNQTEDVLTVTVKATLIVSAKASEDDVYNITKAIFDNIDSINHPKAAELSLENATEGLTVPFHAGAAKYFKEKGIEVATK
jgi:TRAP transporter TAXI family solute receptor